MSELEEVSFWPGKSSYGSWSQGSADGSYSRVGNPNSPLVSCRKRTVLIVVAVVAAIFIIAVGIPAGMLQHYKSNELNAAPPGLAKGVKSTTTAKPAVTNPTDSTPASKLTTKTSNSSAATTTATTTTTKPTVAPKPSFPAWTEYRLPTDVIPTRYDIDIDIGSFVSTMNKKDDIPYNGVVEIAVGFKKAASLIVLHAKEMTVSKVEVAENDTDFSIDNVESFNMTNDDLEHLEIKLKTEYAVNAIVKLRIEFNTTLSDGLHGFYKSSYNVTNGHRTLATTQFESVFARGAFPCFDEPSFKAVFALNITRSNDMRSLFNTEALGHTTIYKQKVTKDSYGPSPSMSSYLVAFTVFSDADFGSIEHNITSTDNHNIDIAIYGQKSQISQLDYALEVTADVVSAYEEFFQIAYPLPKLDIVAIPDFAAGAMENWGLITFRESELLNDEISSSSHQQRVTYVIAHELAHQWFGNLVTMKWWNELWLNEGFATFVGQLIGTQQFADSQNFTWPIQEEFRMDMVASLLTDGLLTSHALSQAEEDVTSLADIESMFDDITYKKGAGVLNMLNNFVTINITKAALKNYLTDFKYSNAEASDLWSAFDKEYKNVNPDANDTAITTMMTSWSSTAGHPVVSAEFVEGGIKVSQTQFFLCKTCNRTGIVDSTWSVPIVYETFGEKDTNAQYLLETAQGMISSTDVKMAVLNLGWNGYYHVNYTGSSKVNITKLTDIDLGNILADQLLLLRGGYMNPTDFVSSIKLAAKADNAGYLTWKMLLNSMWYLLNIFDQKVDDYQKLSAHLYLLLDVSQMNLTYEAVEGMSVRDRSILSSKLAMALSVDHVQVTKDISELEDLTTLWYNKLLNDSISTEGKIHKDIYKQVAICGFLSHETWQTWQALWVKYMESKIPSEKANYRAVLASGSNNLLLIKYLEYGLGKAKQGDTAGIISLVAGNKYGRTAAWDFTKTNWDVLLQRYQDQGFTMDRLISSTTIYFSDESRLAEMKWFYSNNELGAGQVASTQSLEIVQANIDMMTASAKDLLEAVLTIESSGKTESSSKTESSIE